MLQDAREPYGLYGVIIEPKQAAGTTSKIIKLTSIRGRDIREFASEYNNIPDGHIIIFVTKNYCQFTLWWIQLRMSRNLPIDLENYIANMEIKDMFYLIICKGRDTCIDPKIPIVRTLSDIPNQNLVMPPTEIQLTGKMYY